jgi:hypothetical protein
VTLRNDGDYAFRVFGLTLHGEFNATRTWERRTWEGRTWTWEGRTWTWETWKRRTWEMRYHDDEHEDDRYEEYGMYVKIHPKTIPFKLNGSSLIPLFGTQHEHDDDHEDRKFSSLTLQPGKNVTLSFSGVIGFNPERDHREYPALVVTPIVDGNYTLRLMGEGFETFVVTATP